MILYNNIYIYIERERERETYYLKHMALDIQHVFKAVYDVV